MGDLFAVEEPRLGLGGLGAAQAEVVVAPLDEDGAEVEAAGALEEGEILADQLFLQVDGVGRDDDPLFVLLRPEESGDEVGEALAGAGAGFDHCQLAVVEGFGDMEGHAQLFGAFFKIGEGIRHRPARPEDGGDCCHLQRHFSARGKGLHHPVDVADGIVDDEEADAEAAQLRCDIQIGLGGVQPARGMVVDDDVAIAAAREDRRHRLFRAACQHLDGVDDQLRRGAAEEEDLIAAGFADRRSEGGSDGGSQGGRQGGSYCFGFGHRQPGEKGLFLRKKSRTSAGDYSTLPGKSQGALLLSTGG